MSLLATIPTHPPLVKVSANDTTPGYLNGKLTAGTGIGLTVGSPGGNETLSVAVSPGAVDHNSLLNLTTGDPHTQYLQESAFTAGSILFRGATEIAQDNANLFWDRTNLALGIRTATPTQALDVNGYIRCVQFVNQSAVPSVDAQQNASTLQDGSAYTGTDATMSTKYIAVKFTASEAHTMGDFLIRVKSSAGLTNPTAILTGYIYADNGGSPSKPTGAALATGTSIRFGTLTTSYQILSLGTLYAMTQGVSYWLVIVYSSAPTGGSIIFDSDVLANTGATSPDGTTWTNTNVRLRHIIRGRTYYGVDSISTNNIGINGTSTNNIGINGTSTNYIGVLGTSTNHIGVDGTSTNFIGVLGSSTNHIGVYGASTSNIGTYGISASSYGIFGTSTNNIGTYGISTNSYGIFGTSTNSTSGYFSRNTASPASAVPVGYFLQDHASDINSCLDVRQDGTGAIFRAFDDTTEVFRIADGGNIGIGTSTPRRKQDILDVANPQQRWTHTDNSVYGEVQALSSGYVQFTASGGRFGFGVAPLDYLHSAGNVRIGSGGAGVDYALTFDGESSDGVLAWMEDEDAFRLSDDLELNSGENFSLVRGQFIYHRQTLSTDTDGDWRTYSDANGFYVQKRVSGNWTTLFQVT